MLPLPEDMDVPLQRRDTTKIDNVRWLLRNLAANNSDHAKLDETLKTLKHELLHQLLIRR